MISFPSGGARTLRDVLGRLILVLVIIASSGPGCEVMGCYDKERRALLEIKTSINFPQRGLALTDWGSSTTEVGKDCCQWAGITCDSNTGRVVEIDLYSERSSAVETWLPNLTMLVEFRQLERLNLGLNLMGGGIPEVICNLKNLKLLDLSSNRLNGSLPSCLCNLRSLIELDLSYNSLQGDIPFCFDGFHSLKLLNLFSNQFQGNYSAWICSIESLTQLQLSYDAAPGRIPTCLGNLYGLKYLQLGGNELSGTIPSSIFYNLTDLSTLDIHSNGLQGTLKLSALANLSKLQEIDISSSGGLEIDTEDPVSWHPSFQLSHLSIRDCVINKRSNKRFPTFLWTQRRVETLTLKGTSITNTLPFDLFCNSSLSSLDLRNNNISGLFALPCRNASKNAFEINLSDNHAYGQLPESIGLSFPELNTLRIARNELEGHIPTSLADRRLNLLDLSDNHLSGKLPLALTRNQTIFSYLNVSYNQLEGEVFPVDAYMPLLQVLIVKNNKFTGSLLPKLANSSLLFILDAGFNHFTENFLQPLPLLPFMSILSLTKNRIEGYIPRTLCEMQSLRSLDLSGNNLSGDIPPCLHNISSWSSNIVPTGPIWIDSSPADPIVLLTSKSMTRPLKSDLLYMTTLLDLSSNNIHGVIPRKIGELKGLHSLNLSNNQIQGSIPVSMANMTNLESLDLSHNSLSGSIPEEMVHLNYLTTLSLAFNNLSGIIPYREQFMTFTKSSYEGNPWLCGKPLVKDCSSKKERQNSGSLEGLLFYSFCVFVFNLGFWGFLASIFFNLRWRMKYFKLIDELSIMYLRDK